MRWILFAMLLLAGCQSRDGDILARICQRTGKKIETATGGTPNQLASRFRSSTSPIGLAERVHSRIRWDRFLEEMEVEVDSPSEGVVKLSGKVPDKTKKERILDLARATTGVKDVVDELILPREK